jgi:hypothetical protein
VCVLPASIFTKTCAADAFPAKAKEQAITQRAATSVLTERRRDWTEKGLIRAGT